ncbi:MAG: hypothetical protein HYX76_13360 [Acidobacteria bacterium]|nr:hypothetical protein [Acidobacteriota bacterium]
MRTLIASITAGTLALLLAAACSGGGGGNQPPGGGTPPPAEQNPCAGITSAPAARREGPSAGAIDKNLGVIDRRGRWPVLDTIWNHRAAIDRGLILPVVQPTAEGDVGDIAVMQDQGDLVFNTNFYDLRALGLRFAPNAGGGYDVSRTDATFRSPLGTRLTLSDDDSAAVTIPFNFPFYNQTHTAAFVNSDGNITLGEEDRSSSERNVSRLLTGPPRVSPFLSDLDPSAGGGVFVNATSSAFMTTWCNVHAFQSQKAVITQVTLLPDGTIEMKYGDPISIVDAVVGVSPGHTGQFAPVDLTAGGSAGANTAIGERFSFRPELDIVSVAKKFYRTHPDIYDQLVIWTDAPLTIGAFAYEVTVGNEIQGIGLNTFDLSRDLGSAGRLRSLVVMDFLSNYPDDPHVRFLGENTAMSVLGQETGHRWLAFMEFRDHTGRRSDALLGRDQAHWSFFFDSDASVMEGNDIQDLGGGSFRTVAAVQRFSDLDQYAMGLIPESAVPPFFYVENAMNANPPVRGREAPPQIGVTFTGTRRDALIQDVIAVLGTRQPSAAQAPKVHRQAILYVVGSGRSADPGQIQKLDRFRTEWEGFFSRATSGRGRAETRLTPPS